MNSIKLRSQTDWWMNIVGQTPKLTKFAICVFRLTCNFSGCEKNWSTLKSIHTKKINIVERHRLNSLVYVRYKTRLRERNIKRELQKIDPILVDEVDFDDEWITEKEDSLLPEYPCWLEEDNLFAVDIVRLVSLTSYENDLLHESNIGSLRDTSEADPSAKCQKTSETSVRVEADDTDKGLVDLEIDDDDLIFDSDE
nr:uncharacterized protein LOC104644696 [Solanum lycopersicum]